MENGSKLTEEGAVYIRFELRGGRKGRKQWFMGGKYFLGSWTDGDLGVNQNCVSIEIESHLAPHKAKRALFGTDSRANLLV